MTPSQKNKTVRRRKAPTESATSLPEGTMKDGFVIKKASNGVPRWVPETSAELNGFRLFTTDYAAKNIGNPIMLYCREYQSEWPTKTAWATRKTAATYTLMKFVPNGDAIKEKTRILGWLKTQKPAIVPGTHFYVDGAVYEYNSKTREWIFFVDGGLQVDSKGGKLLSLNLMNTEVFVKP
jgi:hypothetical protein